jgi:drug/metabolite transporter (DMT)-like permease
MQVNKLQTISLITPPGAVALGWLLGGEIFSLWSLVGGALVLAGVWMIFRRPEPAAASAPDVGLLSTKQ